MECFFHGKYYLSIDVSIMALQKCVFISVYVLEQLYIHFTSFICSLTICVCRLLLLFFFYYSIKISVWTISASEPNCKCRDTKYTFPGIPPIMIRQSLKNRHLCNHSCASTNFKGNCSLHFLADYFT